MISRFVYFFQTQGIRVVAAHVVTGILITSVFTVIGTVSNRYVLFGGIAEKIFLWQSNLAWWFVRSNFIERYEDGSAIYAGFPFLGVWFIGILSGIPIYTLLSMAIHYLCRRV